MEKKNRGKRCWQFHLDDSSWTFLSRMSSYPLLHIHLGPRLRTSGRIALSCLFSRSQKGSLHPCGGWRRTLRCAQKGGLRANWQMNLVLLVSSQRLWRMKAPVRDKRSEGLGGGGSKGAEGLVFFFRSVCKGIKDQEPGKSNWSRVHTV